MPAANDTISAGLGRYSIGEKLRTLRLGKSMGLVELGKHTGLSAGLLSKLERGKLFPTLPTLLRIAMVFSVGLDYFFTDDRKRWLVGIVRARRPRAFPRTAGDAGCPVLLRVPGLQVHGTQAERIPGGLSGIARGKAQNAHARRSGIPVCVEGRAHGQNRE
ncbi:MAG: helix-turn-helix domain-containing protein [Candidatus Sulfotelmatobacter sp.]